MFLRFIIIFLFFLYLNTFSQNNISIINSGNVKYSKLDSTNLISYSHSLGINEISSFCIGLEFLPGGFDPKYAVISEKPFIDDTSKVTRRLSLSVNYWNNIDTNKIHYSQQFVFNSLDTIKTWIINTNEYCLNITQNKTVNFNTVSKIINLILCNDYKYDVKYEVENGDTLFSVSTFTEDKESLRDDLNKLYLIEQEEDRYHLHIGYYGSGDILECIIRNNQLIIEKSWFWIN